MSLIVSCCWLAVLFTMPAALGIWSLYVAPLETACQTRCAVAAPSAHGACITGPPGPPRSPPRVEKFGDPLLSTFCVPSSVQAPTAGTRAGRAPGPVVTSWEFLPRAWQWAARSAALVPGALGAGFPCFAHFTDDDTRAGAGDILRVTRSVGSKEDI